MLPACAPAPDLSWVIRRPRVRHAGHIPSLSGSARLNMGLLSGMLACAVQGGACRAPPLHADPGPTSVRRVCRPRVLHFSTAVVLARKCAGSISAMPVRPFRAWSQVLDAVMRTCGSAPGGPGGVAHSMKTQQACCPATCMPCFQHVGPARPLPGEL